MRNNPSLKKVLIDIFKIESIAFLIVWLSAYIQLSVFNEAFDSKSWQEAAYLWVIGVCIDFQVLLTAILLALRGRNTSIMIGIGWLFYFISTVSYGKLTFLRFDIDSTLLLSFLKAVEFLILSFFHLLCMFISARIGGTHSREDAGG